MSVTGDQFRDVMGRFATGVTVVTTANGASLHGFTASSFSSVSLDPPLVLVCLGKDAACHQPFVEGDCFAVNILAADQASLSVRFSTDVADRFEGLDFDTWETGAPVLRGVLAAMDCKLHAVHEGGDHSILIGRVERLGPVAGDSAPLLYYRGAYQALA
ncbi:flavin reductase family protein [Nisaea acidiphila]|uniref:Flavin reductase family protein n=1 Tax=Nisaea acidiphila TaxID=1862145 RepID=A0A9J7AY96_9PROT|nr:flavin reductase family protein [Nisaea acidiphila]UUX50405.1 flavin reductase family protein [Nisaea acidiphila]